MDYACIHNAVTCTFFFFFLKALLWAIWKQPKGAECVLDLKWVLMA